MKRAASRSGPAEFGGVSMVRSRRRQVIPVAVVLAMVAGALIAKVVVAPASSPPNVTTAAFDNLRTDWDPNEPNLAPSDVQSGTFGKIFDIQLNGSIYAQPLVYDGTVIATTEKAYAYGINATSGAIIWQRKFGTPFKAKEIGCGDLTPNIGSTSTPVIDPTTGIVYLTTRLQSGSGLSNSHWWLQAVSATTGQMQPGFPVEIQGTPNNSPGVPFNDNYAMQRPALLLLGGVVYMGFASDCDLTPYRGIVVGVSESTASITTMWSDESGVGTDANSQAGIWQSGGGLVSDGPNQILLATGNGIAPPASPGDTPPSTLSESVIRLVVGTNGQLTPTDFFSPSDAPTLDQNDTDLGSGGPVALPSQYFGNTAYPDLLVEVGKDGRIFLLNRDNLGGREQGPGGTDDTLQTLGPFNGVWGHPAVYGGQGGWVYVLESSGGGYLRALSYGVERKRGATAHLCRHEHPVVRLHLGLADRDEQRDDRWQRGRVGRLLGRRTGQARGARGLLCHPDRGHAATALVGRHRGRLQIHDPDQLRRNDLRRKQGREVEGVRDEIQCTVLRHSGQLRECRRRCGQDRDRDGDRSPHPYRDRRLCRERCPRCGGSDRTRLGQDCPGCARFDRCVRYRTDRRIAPTVLGERPEGSRDCAKRRHVQAQRHVQATLGGACGSRGRPDHVRWLSIRGSVRLWHVARSAGLGSADHVREGGHRRRREDPHLHGEQLLEPARDDHGRRSFRLNHSR